MVKEILDNVYLIKVPLPGNPLKALNSYLIKGPKRSLLVDTGFNWPVCKEAQSKAIAELAMNWDDIDFFITHIHGDHSGLVYELAGPNSTVYCSKIDADLMQMCTTETYWKKINAYYIENGYPQRNIKKQGDKLTNWISGADIKFTFVQDGDILEIGDYCLTCVATPGHSPGHMSLYEPQNKFLIAGDHILGTITSNITSWGGTDDYLGLYLSSLDKVNALDIHLILPGHRDIINDHHRRILELKNHHEKRLAQIYTILLQGAMNAYQVASHMHWDVKCNSWEEFPDYQKWFAVGEAIAHLDHLVQLNRLIRRRQDQLIVYEHLTYGKEIGIGTR